MTEVPKISIVTPSFNQGNHLEETICSVLNQNYPNLEYIIIDGGSTDNSKKIIEKYSDKLTYWESQKDLGHYHAVQKGFQRSTGDIMAWINSDDKYHPNSFNAVAEIFTQFNQVDWLMGFPTEFNSKGATTNRISLPWARWSKHRYYTYDFQFIQQESCFWKRSLWEKAGDSLNLDLNIAADMELWTRFFRHSKLFTTTTLLGGFRHHNINQRSKVHFPQYLQECIETLDKEISRFSFPKRIKYSVLRYIGFLMGIPHYLQIPFLNKIYEKVYQLPPVIAYDFSSEKYFFSQKQEKHPPILFQGQQLSITGLKKKWSRKS